MECSNRFFVALGVNPSSQKEIKILSEVLGIPASRLKYYNRKNIIPTGADMTCLKKKMSVDETSLKVKMGVADRALIEKIRLCSNDVLFALNKDLSCSDEQPLNEINPIYKTRLGTLYNTDCLNFLKRVENDSIDMVFADPPFNLNKLYPSKIDDSLKEQEYLKWCEEWIFESIRALKPGGSLFIWNLPSWNSKLSGFISGYMTFKHWISVDIKCSLPIKGRLYPSHYSLLYYVKGEKESNFSPDRLPTVTCPKCFDNFKDYGGRKNKMNPAGVSLADVWVDIHPVRHSKYKKRQGANELPVKVLDRVIEMSTKEGDLILDPFGGSGTSYAVAELKNRRWVGCEIGPCDDAVNRLNDLSGDKENLMSIRSNLNYLYTPKIRSEREKRGLWTCESLKH